MEGTGVADFSEARELAQRIAREVGAPRFYADQRAAHEESARRFEEDPLVRQALAALDPNRDTLGHGLKHSLNVAVDAGAIALVELGGDIQSARAARLVTLAQVAGVLHDAQRSEPDHALLGAEEARRILAGFPLTEDERRAIAGAIENHEAFRPVVAIGDHDAQLISDALYDADKFRWGPDNFSDMLWDMIAEFDIPLSVVLAGFMEGMDGVERIRGTFRSETGRRYGPDFIDRGMEIGHRLYAVLAVDETVSEGDRPDRAPSS